MSDIPERDWKLLREMKPVTLDRLCGRILKSTAEIATASNATNHERFLNLFNLILDKNKEVAAAFDDHRRSTAILKIMQIHRRGLFTEEEFARFSEQTRKWVLDMESI